MGLYRSALDDDEQPVLRLDGNRDDDEWLLSFIKMDESVYNDEWSLTDIGAGEYLDLAGR